MNTIRKTLQQFWREEDGIGTLEILLIIAVIVIIAIAFRKWIISWVNKMFSDVNTDITTKNNQTVIEPSPT
ncbi:MAG: hypothetical protein JWM44_1157 [Bacilli bacterium]|nr:hypothetical protein [Bacilli bacterium]